MKTDLRNEDIKKEIVGKYQQAIKYLIRTLRSKKKVIKDRLNKGNENFLLLKKEIDSIQENIIIFGQILNSLSTTCLSEKASIGSVVFVKHDSVVGKEITGKYYIVHLVDNALVGLDLGGGVISISSDSKMAQELLGKKKDDVILNVFNDHDVEGKITNIF